MHNEKLHNMYKNTLVLQLHVCTCSKINMKAHNGVHKTDEVCILEVCVYLQISCNCL